MSDHASIIQSVISGVLTGGASAGTAFITVFKDIKKRLGELEGRVGTDKADPKTGVFYSIEILSESVRRIRREIDSWQDDPPDWAIRASRRSSVTMEHQHELEQRVEQRLRAFSQMLKRFEEDFERREAALERTGPSSKIFISRAEYDEDSRQRALEMAKMRENMSSANVWLRGVLTALGYIDSDPASLPPPKLPPPKRK